MKNIPEFSSHKKILSATILFLTILILSSFTVAEDDAEQESDVTVEIEEETIIDIQPDELAWGTDDVGLAPGSVGGMDEEQNDYGNIFIENLGSVDITDVWFETTSVDNDEDPFLGEGSYDASNMVTLGEDISDDLDATFVDRKEYAMSEEDAEDFIFMDIDDGWTLGRFRVANQEFFWSYETGETIEDLEVRVAEDPRVVESDDGEATGETGTTDLTSDGNDYVTLENFGENDGDTLEIDSDPETDGAEPINAEYCVVPDLDDDVEGSLRFIDWNVQDENVDGSCDEAVQEPLDGDLEPGQFSSFDIRVFVPFGVPAEDPIDGELRILATSD